MAFDTYKGEATSSQEVYDLRHKGGVQTAEIRLTDPKTGAQKGSKLARFDLVPASVSRIRSTRSVWDTVEHDLDAFWNQQGSMNLLIHAGRVIADVLGPRWEQQLAEVFGFGAAKYEDRNWEKGYKWSWSYAALRRHLALHVAGEYYDQESGLPHLAHALWHIVVLLAFEWWYPELDDRPKRKAA